MIDDDNNHNWFPAIYHMMGESNPTMPVHEQYHTFRQAMRDEGEEEDTVVTSAYLPYGRHDLNWFMDYSKSKIMPWLSARSSLCSSGDDYTIAFVWDLEDVSMLSRKHMREISYLRPNIDSMSLYRLVNNVLRNADFVNPDEEPAGFLMNILDVFQEEHHSTTTRAKYNALKKMYEDVSKEVGKKKSIISHELLKQCNMVNEEKELCETAKKVQEIYHQRWKTVQKSLDLVNRRSAKSKTKKFANVVISNEGIAKTVAQLAVSKHCQSIPIENIYSTLYLAEESVWRRIQKRFGEKCFLIYVTSPYPSNLPDELTIRRWPIRANDAIKYLYKVQRDHMLEE